MLRRPRFPAALLRASLNGRSGATFRCLFVKVESTPNPDSLKFLPEDRLVLHERFGAGVHFDRDNSSTAVASKLAKKLLKLPAVTGVFLGRDFVSVNKTEDASWAALKTVVLSSMMDALAEPESLAMGLAEEVQVAPEHMVHEEDDEVVAMIKELLETRIRPAVQEDGGDILFVGFDDGIVKVRLAGSCVGCPSSAATLRNGVENMLMHYIPEVRGIAEVKGEVDAASDRALAQLESRLAAAGAT